MKDVQQAFGARLRNLRKERGLTQTELGAQVGMSKRMMAYYEQQHAQPPGPLLAKLALALGTTTDELLGIKAPKSGVGHKAAKILKRVQAIADLPPSDQRAILRIIDGFLQSRGYQPHRSDAA